MIYLLEEWSCEEGLLRLQLSRYNTITSFSLTCWSDKRGEPGKPVKAAMIYFHMLPRPLGVAGSSISYNEKRPRGTCTSSNPGLWRHWIRTCSETHKQCHKPSTTFVPKRLIEIIADASNTAVKWKLTEWDSTTPSRPDTYITLSHCWGKSLHTCLTRANINEFFAENMVSDLGKTYRDAMDITLALGHRYIWIDSLCIIQGDAVDWKEQSTVMGLVYKHATCNIAATWAVDGTQGCFNKRDPATVQYTSITMETNTGAAMACELVRYNKLHFEVNRAPLNDRAWVLQERYLTPRQFNFAANEVFWECPQLVASEQYPDGVPEEVVSWSLSDYTSIALGLKPRLDYADEQTLRRVWNGLIGT